MKIVGTVSLSKIKLKPLDLNHFSKEESAKCLERKISKKHLKSLADELGLFYTEEQINFTKKMMLAYKETL